MNRMVKAYAENNLIAHEGKRVRRAAAHTGWGARVMGIRGVSMAPQEKTLAQMVLTLCLIKLQAAPLLFLQIVMGGGFLFSFLGVPFSPCSSRYSNV